MHLITTCGVRITTVTTVGLALPKCYVDLESLFSNSPIYAAHVKQTTKRNKTVVDVRLRFDVTRSPAVAEGQRERAVS